MTECCGSVLLVACGRSVPVEPDFVKFLEVAATNAYGKVWVHTTGGYYDAVQRKRAAQSLERARLVAIMTDSVVARSAVTAFSWIRPGVRAFSGSAFEQAAAYLGAGDTHVERFRALIGKVA